MRSTTGRWVSGSDFFDREAELELLESLVRDRNHVLLSGQRRMGKTSIARELGRRLESQGWSSLFVDVEGGTCPEDVIADIAQATHPVRAIAARFANAVNQLIGNIEELDAVGFRMKVRADLNTGNWQRHGTRLLEDCASHEKPVLLVIDELPIFLKRLIRDDGGDRRVEEYLSWMRGVLQILGERAPVVMVSGSIGLAPLVKRLRIPDRINHLYPWRLGPWSREASVACFNRLATDYGLQVEAGVADAVYEALGLGIPHHVQIFFARLRDSAIMSNRDRVTVQDVAEVYRTGLLGPTGQSMLAYYETRLREALDDASHTIAMEILAEAATQGAFTPKAERRLGQLYRALVEDPPSRIADALDVLEHDGYLCAPEKEADGYRFQSNLLKDWWSARFGNHHVPVERRRMNRKGSNGEDS